MKHPMLYATSGNIGIDDLRRDLQEEKSSGMGYRRAIVGPSLVGIASMGYRRAIVGPSLVGIASMGIVSLFQTGIIRHLPDPPVKRPHFHSDKVNASTEAYSYGMSDAPIALTAHGINIMLAAAGPSSRTQRRPWLPLMAAAVAGTQAVVAAKYLFYQMPKVDRAWCPYCVVDALVMLGTFILTIPEACRAVVRLGRRRM